MRPFVAPAATTIGELIDEYLASAEYGRLAPSTRRSYARSLAVMTMAFGDVRPDAWEPAWGQHWLLQRSNTPAAANMELAALSVVMARAVRAGVLSANPCREVRRHPSPPRDRYVGDLELAAFRKHCTERANAYIDLKLTTGARQGQLAVVRWSDWDGSTLFVAAAKGGKDTWYDGVGVRTALARCALAFHRLPLERAAALDSPIIVTRAGRAYTTAKQMIKSLWHPAMKRHTGTGAARFREHDLRAKVASDSPDLGVAQARLGHQTNTITERVYRRAPRRVRSVDIRRSQPDLFDHMGGPAASLPEKSAGNRRSAERARSPLRRGCPAGPPANPETAAASVQSPAPPGRAARKPKATRGDSEAGTPPSGGRTARAAP